MLEEPVIVEESHKTMINLDCLILYTEVDVGFSEADYTGREETEQAVLTLERNKAIEMPLTVRVTPLTYREFLSMEFPEPLDFPDIHLRASSKQSYR